MPLWLVGPCILLRVPLLCALWQVRAAGGAWAGQQRVVCAGQTAAVVSHLQRLSRSKCHIRENWKTHLTYKTIPSRLL